MNFTGNFLTESTPQEIFMKYLEHFLFMDTHSNDQIKKQYSIISFPKVHLKHMFFISNPKVLQQKSLHKQQLSTILVHNT